MKIKVVDIKRIAKIVIACLALYCILIGPAYLLLRKGQIDQNMFSTTYAPILNASRHSAFCSKVVRQYVTLWYAVPQAGNDWVDGLVNTSAREGVFTNNLVGTK